MKPGNRGPRSQFLEEWIEARRRFHLSHAQVQMARELGMSPRKLGKLANHDQEPWKTPLPLFIEDIYLRRFGKEQPDVVLSVEERERLASAKKAAQADAPGCPCRGQGRDEMSEYQYYEFLAVDRPLSAEEMAELPLSDSRPDHAHHLRQRLHVGQLQGRRGGGKVRASRVRRRPWGAFIRPPRRAWHRTGNWLPSARP